MSPEPRVPDPRFSALIQASGITPVLVDVGAAGVAQSIWDPIAAHSVLVGFEPDTRNSPPNFGAGYQRAVLARKVVCADAAASTVQFILTEYPSCSSMLAPDMASLASFSFRDYFRPVSTAEVPATTLPKLIAEENLGGIHWLKVDSQGMDLRLVQSLGVDHLPQLLAVDIEPGLISAYLGEDLFTDCHRWLVGEGFWLSELKHQAYPKIRPESLATLADSLGVVDKDLARRLPKAPTAVEARYLREVDWLLSQPLTRGHFLLAGVFGLIDKQGGYTYDVACAYRERFGNDAHLERLLELALDACR